jgi:hypothetical protein
MVGTASNDEECEMTKNADEGMDELFEEGVDDAYHANSSAVYTLEHVQDETPEKVRQACDITPECSPDGLDEPELIVPITKAVANLVLVLPLTKRC